MRIEIAVDGRSASVDARHAAAVDPLVSAPAIRFVSEGGQVLGRTVRESLGAVRGDRYEFPARLADRVAAARRGRGDDVVVTDPLGRPAAPPVGLLVLGRPPAGHLEDILLHLADRRTAFVARNREAAGRWRDRLDRLGLPQPVVGAEGVGWGPRVVVLTLTGLGHGRREDFDAAVVPDAGPLLASGRHRGRDPGRRPDWDLLLRADVRAFGFAPGVGRLTRAERLVARALFGRLLCDRPDAGR